MLLRAALVLPFAAVTAFTVQAQDTDSSPVRVFTGEMREGSWLRIRTMKGLIEVREGSGRTATVSATRRYRGPESDQITFEVVRDGANVTVCAKWPRTTRCDAGGYDSESWRDNRGNREGTVSITVALPRGVKLLAATGNGEVDVRNAGAEVRASSGNGEVSVRGADGPVRASSGNGDITVDAARGEVDASSGNGDIRVSTSLGPVSASTGNGRIEAQMSALSGPGNMEFSTGNGSIVATFPANFSGTIDANVPVNKFETEFPMELPARWSSRHVEGKIGSGGGRVRFSTGNGRVSIRKSSSAL